MQDGRTGRKGLMKEASYSPSFYGATGTMRYLRGNFKNGRRPVKTGHDLEFYIRTSRFRIGYAACMTRFIARPFSKPLRHYPRPTVLNINNTHPRISFSSIHLYSISTLANMQHIARFSISKQYLKIVWRFICQLLL